MRQKLLPRKAAIPTSKVTLNTGLADWLLLTFGCFLLLLSIPAVLIGRWIITPVLRLIWQTLSSLGQLAIWTVQVSRHQLQLLWLYISAQPDSQEPEPAGP